MTEVSGGGARMSVVIPNYNHGHFIGEALTAISGQTRLPAEVVVVDDGSTDDSVARLQSLAARMPWLRLHRHGENRGVNAACNTGLGLVSGDFVLFSAADDRVDANTVEGAFAAAAAFPSSGIIFSDQAEMSADGTAPRIMPLDLPPERRHFSAQDFVRLLQRNFFYFHVSGVWFNVKLLRALGGFAPELRWHGDLFAAYAAAFEQGATYTPGAVSYFRIGQQSYSVTGARSRAQRDVLRAWLAVTRRPGWEKRRAGFVAAAMWPDYSFSAVPVLMSDLGYVTPRLVRRLIWLTLWSKLAPLVGAPLRARMRSIRSRYRRARS